VNRTPVSLIEFAVYRVHNADACAPIKGLCALTGLDGAAL